MAWAKVWAFIDKHVALLGSVLLTAVVAIAVIENWVPALKDFVIRQNLWSVLIIGLMVVVLDHLVKLHPQPAKPAITLCATNAAARKMLGDYLAERSPRRADLIEYSAFTVGDLLGQLRHAHSEVRLLLQHPDSAANPFQRDRIRTSLANLENVTFFGYDRHQIRCYRVPASVRARCFDNDLVTIGWYRYVRGNSGVNGDGNPMVTAIGHAAEGRELIEWFREAFDELWTHPSTVDASAVPLA